MGSSLQYERIFAFILWAASQLKENSTLINMRAICGNGLLTQALENFVDPGTCMLAKLSYYNGKTIVCTTNTAAHMLFRLVSLT